MEKVKLNEVTWFQEGPGVRNTQYTESGVKLLNVANLVNGKVVLSNTSRFISEDEAFGKYKHFLCDDGDLIIASSGIKVEYLDKKMGFVTKDMLPLCMNTSTIRFKVKDKNQLDIKYLMYFFKSNIFKDQIQKLITGSAQLNYGPSHLNKVFIKMNTMNKQKEIVNKLDKITNMIENQEKMIKKYDDLIKSQFIEMFGDPVENTKKWETIPLGELCEITRGGSPRPIEKYLGGNIPWIKIGDATDGDNIYLSKTKEYIIEDGVKKSRLIKQGSLIFANCGVSLGFARIIKFDGCIHDGWLALQNISPKLNKVFLLMSINQMTEHFRSIAPAGTQPNLNTAIMKAHKQIIPPIELQNEYIDFVKHIDKLKFTLKQTLEKLENCYNSLMQEYFE